MWRRGGRDVKTGIHRLVVCWKYIKKFWLFVMMDDRDE